MNQLKKRIEEFKNNVWDHTQDSFLASFDTTPPFTPEESRAIREILKLVEAVKNEDRFLESLREIFIRENDRSLLRIIQLTGLTRSKIITDVKAQVRSTGSRIPIPGDPVGVVRNKGLWQLSGPYLSRRIRALFKPILRYKDPLPALAAVNVATWPGYIRQERAKRSGHHAEQRLAELLYKLEVPFVPKEKFENPLYPDIKINGVSFDLVIPDATNPVICVKSTIHTSNIGQFGESKDALEVNEAQDMLASWKGKRPILLCLIDGVGFESNTAGLTDVLKRVDEFCQFNTLWKAVMLMAPPKMKLTFHLTKDDIRNHADFLRTHMSKHKVQRLAKTIPAEGVKAGKGFISK